MNMKILASIMLVLSIVTSLAGITGPQIALSASAEYNQPLPPSAVSSGTPPTRFVRASEATATEGTYVNTGFVLKVVDGVIPVQATITISALERTQKFVPNLFAGDEGQVMRTGNGTLIRNFAFGSYNPPAGALPDMAAYNGTTSTTSTTPTSSSVTGDRVVLSEHQHPLNGQTVTTNGGRPWLLGPGNAMTVEYHLTGTYKTGAAAPVSFDLRATARVIVLSDTRLWEFGVVAGKGGWIISLPGVVSGEEQFWVLEKSTDLVNWSPGDPGDTAVVVDDVLHWTPAFVPGSTRCFWRARLNYGG